LAGYLEPRCVWLGSCPEKNGCGRFETRWVEGHIYEKQFVNASLKRTNSSSYNLLWTVKWRSSQRGSGGVFLVRLWCISWWCSLETPANL
jgi:hypothetical protein